MNEICFGSQQFIPVEAAKAVMPMPTTHTIRLSISRNGYENKEGALKALKARGKNRIAFKERGFNILELAEYVKNGYVFCHCYDVSPVNGWMNTEAQAKRAIKHIGAQRAARAIAKSVLFTAAGWVFKGKGVKVAEKINPFYSDGYWKIQYKAELYWESASCVFVDIDSTSCSTMEEFVAKVNRVIPFTLAYPTYSDKEGARRFRLVYFLDQKVSNYDVFSLVATYIHSKVSAALGETITDNCGKLITQQFYGTNKQEVIMQNYMIDVDTAFTEQTRGLNRGLFKEEDGTYSIDLTGLAVENVFDVNVSKAIRFTMMKPNNETGFKPNSVNRTMWLLRHEYNCKIYNQTDVDFQGKSYADIPEDYLRLMYNNGEDGKQRVFRDGEHRRGKLFARLLLRRYMAITHKMEVTPTDYLANIFTDYVNIIDNSDGSITYEVLKAIVIRTLILTDEEVIEKVERYYNRFFDNSKHNFLVNMEGLNTASEKATARNIAQGDYTDTKIAEVFDKTKTIDENLELLKDNDIEISKSQLYRWAKKNNIETVDSRDKGIATGYNPELSLRENQKEMGCSYRQVIKARDEYNKRNK